MLRSFGYTTSFFRDGETALGGFGTEPFDLVLMDVQMPGIGGHETTRRLRAGGAGKLNQHTRVIALTAGQTLNEHENPGEATIHVLHGRVRLAAGDTSWDGTAGDLLIVPDSRHSLEALDEAAVLLTVAKHP